MLIPRTDHDLRLETSEQHDPFLSSFLTNHKTTRVDCYTLCAIIGFINANKPICQLEHVVSEAAGYIGVKKLFSYII